MSIREERNKFYNGRKIYESNLLTFHGVDGFDVYNPSVPFVWKGKRYIYGRVERRGEWANSIVRLFTETGRDNWTVVPDSMIYQLEDPFVSFIHDRIVLGGTHVRKKQGKIDTYYGYFYQGQDINNLTYFATGPDRMKDIRLVELKDKRIGVFSRPRGPEIKEKYGSDSLIGFTVINDLSELNEDIVNNAKIIENLFDDGEWGGCNQCYALDNGMIGVIGHRSYESCTDKGEKLLSYLNISFIFDVNTHKAKDLKVIGTKDSYPPCPAKVPNLADCAFTSGIVLRADGKADLYSGIGDTHAGRIVIDNPFEGYTLL